MLSDVLHSGNEDFSFLAGVNAATDLAEIVLQGVRIVDVSELLQLRLVRVLALETDRLLEFNALVDDFLDFAVVLAKNPLLLKLLLF